MLSTDQLIGRALGDRKRRNQKPRVLQSCSSCRERKLKCDRKIPCGNCTKRKHILPCSYVADRSTEAAKEATTSSDESGKHDGPNNNQTSKSTPKRTHPRGLLLSGPSGTRYMASAHWQAIMDATRKLKQGSHHTDGEDTDNSERSMQGPYLLLGLAAKMSITDLLAALPDRSTVESLVSNYFNSQEPSLTFIHGPTFRNECNEIWKSPTKVSPAWLAILYGILSCAVWIDHITDIDSPRIDSEGPRSFDIYRKQCALCLTSSNYTLPGRYKVEALGLYLGLEYLPNNNLKTSVSVLLAICIRLATLMGYHRDAQPYSQITIFEAEMRRRVWLFLQVTDSIVSWQTGVPRVLSRNIGDTAFPQNLLDEDFGPTDIELPPPRPETHLTSRIVYMISMARVLSVTSEISDTISMKSLSYEETTLLNHQLELARDKIPHLLKTNTTNSNKTMTDQDLNIQRYSLEIIFQHARCILHRQYLLTHRSESKYEHFRRICVDSARRILEHQTDLFQGIFRQARQHSRVWFGASVSISNCLTAAMVICFEIIYLSQADQMLDGMYRAELIVLLQSSYDAWKLLPKPSFETSKAADTIASMLNLVHSDYYEETVCSSVTVEDSRQIGSGYSEESSNERVENTGIGSFSDILSSDSSFEMFDWGLWDREMMEMNSVIANHITS